MPFDVSLRTVLGMLVFMLIAVLVGSGLAASGGWQALWVRYPARAVRASDEERYRFVSLRTSGGLVGTATYNSCAIVGVGPAGISLSLWGPFRFRHPPLSIPWDAVERCRLIEGPGGELVQFAVKHAGTVTIRGAAGTAVFRQAASRGITDGGPSAW